MVMALYHPAPAAVEFVVDTAKYSSSVCVAGAVAVAVVSTILVVQQQLPLVLVPFDIVVVAVVAGAVDTGLWTMPMMRTTLAASCMDVGTGSGTGTGTVVAGSGIAEKGESTKRQQEEDAMDH